MFKLSIIGKITLISFILQAIILSILEAFVVYFHLNFVKQYNLCDRGKGISEADLIYHAIFILSLFFQVFLAAEALWHRNTVQIIGLVIFNFLSLIYAGIQLYQHEILEDEGTIGADYTPDSFFPINDSSAPKYYYEARMRPIEYTIIGLISGFSLYLPFLSYLLVKEFGWENYKTYSADIQLRDTHMSLTILQTLIKMNLFFIGSFALQLIPSRSIGYASYFWSIAEVIFVFFSGAVMLVMAWFSVTMEKKYLLLVVINLYSLSLIYWLYRLISVNVRLQNDSDDPYQFTRRFLTFFLATIFALVLLTIFYSIICFRNMRRGLYVLTVFGRPENDANIKTNIVLPRSRRESAIQQQQLRAKERESRIILD